MPHWFSLRLRIALGIAFFAVYALVDLLRHGRHANRWREYLFLVACTTGAVAYGVINDLITSRISWEYFYYGKELFKILGSDAPPDRAALDLQAARIGAQASWAAGLIAAALLLFINSRRQRTRQPLPYRRLLAMVGGIALLCVVFAAVLGVVGYFGGLNWIDREFAEMYRFNLWRPRRFTAVFGVHLGGYAGVFVGTVLAAGRIWTSADGRRSPGTERA